MRRLPRPPAGLGDEALLHEVHVKLDAEAGAGRGDDVAVFEDERLLEDRAVNRTLVRFLD